MAINGKSRILTTREKNKLQKLIETQVNITGFLSEKGMDLQTLRRPISTGKVSDKVYKRLLAADLL